MRPDFSFELEHGRGGRRRFAVRAGVGLWAALLLNAIAIADDDDAATIRISGSDTMLQLNLTFSEAYREHTMRTVVLDVRGEGSSVGFRDLIAGDADLAASVRPMRDAELARFKAEHRKSPTEHVVAYALIAVFVHPENPCRSVSAGQLRQLFGSVEPVANWKEIEPGFDAEVVPVGRSNSSATYGAFAKHLFNGAGEFRRGTATANGSRAVIEWVGATPGAIGYSGLSYETEAVRALSISVDGEPVKPSAETARDGSYPFTRKLYYYAADPGAPKVKRFLDWIAGTEGSRLVEESGFVAPE